MRFAKAPDGWHTQVNVSLRLDNGRCLSYAWDTPRALHGALHKAPGWARQEMKREGRRGRTKIVKMTVCAEYHKGNYTKGADTNGDKSRNPD